MKRILRAFIIETGSLYLASFVASGLEFENGTITILLAGSALTVVSFLVKPISNLLLLPLNLVTFGLFKWVSSVLALYLVTLLVPGFAISSFAFHGLSTQWFSLPGVTFSGFPSFIAFSFLLSFISSLAYWLVK